MMKVDKGALTHLQVAHKFILVHAGFGRPAPCTQQQLTDIGPRQDLPNGAGHAPSRFPCCLGCPAPVDCGLTRAEEEVGWLRIPLPPTATQCWSLHISMCVFVCVCLCVCVCATQCCLMQSNQGSDRHFVLANGWC